MHVCSTTVHTISLRYNVPSGLSCLSWNPSYTSSGEIMF